LKEATTLDERQHLADLAEKALAEGGEEQAEAHLASWLSRNAPDVTLLHWTAMLRRALDRRDGAVAALEAAHRLAPGNAGVVHALAHVSLEAGLPSAALFEQAIRLAPAKGEIRLGLASARLADGEGDRALGELEAMLGANPGWMEGHRQFAQLAVMAGQEHRALASIEAALQRFPQSESLRNLAIDLLLSGERYAEALAVADRAIATHGAVRPFVLARAAALDELGRSAEAGVAFGELGPATDSGHAVWRLRHWLRRGEVAQAVAEIEPWLARSGAEAFWPYAAIAWRLAGDARSDWLDGQDGLFRVIDLDPAEIGLDALVPMLRRLHARSGRFLDQSVRGGTQTDGALLGRCEPELVRVREVLRREVARFEAELPPVDPAHPMLGQKRVDRPRFAGSWSVRLVGAGFHAPHHHPQGWISSALYLSVPDGLRPGEGWLDLGGAPAGLGDFAPRASVEPKPARLVLFPSWMWHGTRPFAAGERMTIAFDIART
jgi:tetratricopeptide (TPR) repeat protein